MRRFAGALLSLVSAPVLYFLFNAPRRQVNLQRWTRSREFRNMHDIGVAWLDSHFELIEHNAPWLHEVGRDVEDFCEGIVKPFLTFAPGPRANAGCVRHVTAVYGFDGPLVPRLRTLGLAMPVVGWEMSDLAVRQSWMDLDPGGAANAIGPIQARTRWMIDRQVNLDWRPSPALDYPPRVEGMRPWGQPPLEPRMRVTWSSRRQEPVWLRNPHERRGATRNYLPLEVSERGVLELLDEALTRYEHALTVTIEFSYYSNPNSNAPPHRMPQHLIPTWPRH